LPRQPNRVGSDRAREDPLEAALGGPGAVVTEAPSGTAPGTDTAPAATGAARAADTAGETAGTDTAPAATGAARAADTAGETAGTDTAAVARTSGPATVPVPTPTAPTTAPATAPSSPPTAPLRTTGPVTAPEPLEVAAAPARARRERAAGAPRDRRATRPRAAVFRRRPRVRRVTRVVRSVDAWTVFKVSAVFWLATYVIALVAGVLLWNVAHTTGTVENVERFFTQFGWASFEFKGGEIYHAAWTTGLFAVVGLVGFSVFLATVFNLITQLVGGIRVSVLEEEVLVRARPAANAVDEPAATTGIVVDRPGL
jgi:hypothetical protein